MNAPSPTLQQILFKSKKWPDIQERTNWKIKHSHVCRNFIISVNSRLHFILALEQSHLVLEHRSSEELLREGFSSDAVPNFKFRDYISSGLCESAYVSGQTLVTGTYIIHSTFVAIWTIPEAISRLTLSLYTTNNLHLQRSMKSFSPLLDLTVTSTMIVKTFRKQHSSCLTNERRH